MSASITKNILRLKVLKSLSKQSGLKNNTRKVKICANLPNPPELSAEDWERIKSEADEWSKEMRKIGKEMEQLTAADMSVLIR